MSLYGGLFIYYVNSCIFFADFSIKSFSQKKTKNIRIIRFLYLGITACTSITVPKVTCNII